MVYLSRTGGIIRKWKVCNQVENESRPDRSKTKEKNNNKKGVRGLVVGIKLKQECRILHKKENYK